MLAPVRLRRSPRLVETGYPAGTIRKHSDGNHYQKQKDGTWVQVVVKKSSTAATDKPLDEPKSAASGQASKPSQFHQQSLFGDKPPVPGTHVKPSPGAHWHDSPSSGPKRPPTTMELHFKNGKPTPERQKLHDQIAATFLQQVKPTTEGKPVAIMLMGGPASGKGVLSAGLPDDEFVRIDADAIKEMLPEYAEAVSKGDRQAASHVHEESSWLASRLKDQAIASNRSLLIDGTGQYVGSYLNRINQLHDAGYHVHVAMPDVDAETAVQRAHERGQKTGRWVPEHIVRRLHATIPGNFEEIAAAADSAQLFDNRGAEPRQVWSKQVGQEKVHDAVFMKKFREQHRPSEPPKKPQVDNLDVVRQVRDLLSSAGTSVPLDLGRIAQVFAQQSKQDRALMRKTPSRFGLGQGILVPTSLV